MAESILTVHLTEVGATPTALAAELLRSGQSRREVMRRIADRITRITSGVGRGKATVRLDGSAAAQATITLTADVSDATAGDKLWIDVPGYPAAALTVVATGATAADGEVAADESDDSDFGDAIVAAIQAYPPLKRHFTASNSTGTVTVTAKAAGSWANAIAFTEDVDSNSPFAPGASTMSGGADAGDAPTASVTFDGESNAIVADDTVSVGDVTFVWKASPSGEDQIDIGNDNDVDAATFAAAVNAHSKLQGLVDAVSDGTDTVTLTWRGDPRAGQLVTLSRSETNSGSVTWSAAALGTTGTESYGAAPRSFTWGAV